MRKESPLRAITGRSAATALAGLLLLALASAAGAGDFPARIARIEALPPEARRLSSDSLQAELRLLGAPVREDGLAHFVWFGPARTVTVAGDMNGWSPGLPLRNLAGTDLWTGSFPLPADARIDYKFVRDGTQWLLDPLNSRRMQGGFGENSELAMPLYEEPAFLRATGLPGCAIFVYDDFRGPERGDSRLLRVVVPPGAPGGPRPLLVVHDGGEYLEIAQLAGALAWLAAQGDAGRLPICVCIPPVDRTPEYAGAKRESYSRFVTETVLPFVEKNFAVEPAAAGRWGSMGASYGGRASLHLAESRPETFRRLALMSPSIQGDPELDYESLRVHLAWGRYDIADLIPGCEKFAALLAERGTRYEASVWSEGHSWGLWRALLPEAIAYLYPER